MENRFPWTNLGTLLLSGAGIWFIVRSVRSPMGSYPLGAVVVFPLLVLGFAFLVALWQVILASVSDEEGRPRNVKDPGRFYIRGLNLLSSERWLLVLFVCIAVLNAASIVAGSMESHWLHLDRLAISRSLGVPPVQYVRREFQSLVFYFAQNSPSALLPRTAINLGVSGVASLVIALCAFGAALFCHFKKLPAEPRARDFLAKIVMLLFLSTLLVTVLEGSSIYRMVSSFSKPTTYYSQGRLNAGAGSTLAQETKSSGSRPRVLPRSEWAKEQRTRSVTVLVWYPVFRLILTPLMIGGIFGMLKRRRSGEEIAVPVFVEDAFRYFKPLSVVYLITLVAAPRFFTPWVASLENLFGFRGSLPWGYSPWLGSSIVLLLIFAPCAVILRDLEGLESVKVGVKLWAAKAHDILPFAAFAMSLHMVTVFPTVAHRAISLQYGSYTEAGITAGAVSEGILTFITVVTVLAVWELAAELMPPPPSDACHEISSPGREGAG